VRFTVLGLDTDRDLIRALARRLANPGPEAERLRTALALNDGDKIEIHVVDERKFAAARKASGAELLNQLRAFRGRLPPDFKFDRDEANAR
jgi:antitoxin MazE